MRFQLQGWSTPHKACDVIIPPDSVHQPLPREILADRYSLGRCRWDSNCKPSLMRRLHGRLLASCLARHSVTPRCCLSWLSFLALSDFQRVGSTGWVVEPGQHYGLNGRALVALRLLGVSCPWTGWCNDGGPSHRWAQLGNKYCWAQPNTLIRIIRL